MTPTPAGVSTGDSYESWPVVAAASNGDLIVAYGDGSQHALETARQVKVQRSTDDGATWGAASTLVNTAADDAIFSIGVDSLGDLVAFVRHITGAGVYSHKLYASTDDGATWAERDAPTLSPMPVVIGPIASVAGVGLMAWWHAGPESGEGVRSYGIVTSADDGATWSQTTIATGVAEVDWVVEGRLVDLGGGTIVGVGRTEVANEPLFQMTSTDSGATWAIADTNIHDQYRTPAALVLHGTRLDLYFWDRNNGMLRYRSATAATVLADPSAWSSPSLNLASGTQAVADNGYPHAVGVGSSNVVVWYTGSSTTTQIKKLTHTP